MGRIRRGGGGVKLEKGRIRKYLRNGRSTKGMGALERELRNRNEQDITLIQPAVNKSNSLMLFYSPFHASFSFYEVIGKILIDFCLRG